MLNFLLNRVKSIVRVHGAMNEPIADSEDRFLNDHTMEEYEQWFLATNDAYDRHTKEHYEFPIGDFNEIYREGLITAKKRAAQYKHDLVEYAADELLRLIDKVC